ncbi:glutathione reductase (NADPH) [Palleronia aestuarii]|uniref:Glutathione reductase (NADPH) n=1 Tax=Palleronia aestuarii TaxID=568105 RepID=A0A2W7NJS8_9RHOB|nr:FAD-dependent oxidoreductase [Palleronia aestuarii]PZX19713.1 glutathione reductase (NADPH) [Palleronia aestuarii]
MAEFDYDLFVIGGGSGGVRAARTAAATGARVALAEDYRLGGTCVIRGCVPKKIMVFASGYPDLVAEADAYGWDAQIGDFDWKRFRAKLHAELDRLEGVYRNLLNTSGVAIYETRARLQDAHHVALATGEVKSAAHILVATGGHPVRPGLENAEFGLVSNDLFLLEDLPSNILIIGGGYIACEFACILNGLGVDVTQYYRGEQILRGFDDEARDMIADRMRERGIDLQTNMNISEMDLAEKRGMSDGSSHGHDGRAVTLDDNPMSSTVADAAKPLWVKDTEGREHRFDHVLFATGRAPSTADMGLEDAGVSLGKKGEIVVDAYSQSSVPSIYAIGDVTDRLALTPVAIREAMAFVKTVFRGEKSPVDHELVPSAIFTQPEFGTIGLTEQEGFERGGVEIYRTSFTPMKKSFAGGSGKTMMKLVVDSETRVVLGCHIVAEDAGEMIQLAGIAVKAGLTKEQFDATCAVHPTSAEELVTMSSPVRKG